MTCEPDFRKLPNMPEPDVQVDLSSYPDVHSDEFQFLSFDEQYELEDYHTLTEEATAVPPGQKILCKYFCVEEKGEFEMCQGDVEVVRMQELQQIRWKCLKCGYNGIITGFENSSSDLSGLSPEELIKYMNEKYGDPFDLDEGLSFDNFLEGELASMIPETQEEFVNWYNSLGEQEKEAIRTDLGIDIDQLTDEFRKTAGGLSPADMFELLSADWEEADNPVQLNSELPAAELEKGIFFRNSRTLLLKAQREDGIGLTQTGNMQRKPISELIPDCIWPEGYIENVKEFNKVINEHDVWLLHVCRVLLQLSGLLHKHKGKLKGIKKNAQYSLNSRSGELYRHLFITYFRKMNISHLSYKYYEYLNLQESVPYILHRTQQLADKWIPIEDLTGHVLLPSVYEEVMETHYWSNDYGDLLYSIVIKPLELFGLMETRKTGKKPDWSYAPDECRKTPLFDKFISFRI